MSHKTVDETTLLISANYNVESLIKVSQSYKKGRGKKSMKVLTTVSYIWCFNQTYHILFINTLNNESIVPVYLETSSIDSIVPYHYTCIIFSSELKN